MICVRNRYQNINKCITSNHIRAKQKNPYRNKPIKKYNKLRTIFLTSPRITTLERESLKVKKEDFFLKNPKTKDYPEKNLNKEKSSRTN